MPLSHVTLFASDVDASLRFYCEGLGLQVKLDREFEGPWPELFGVTSPKLRAIFLGDDERMQQIELLSFAEDLPTAPVSSGPALGVAMVAFLVDFATVLPALEKAGFGAVNEAKLLRGTRIATLRDPDGRLVELIDTAAPAA